MSTKPTAHHLDSFVAHSVSTLPDSLRARKTILVTLLSLLPKNYHDRARLWKLLENLHQHESAQLKFNTIIRHDGH